MTPTYIRGYDVTLPIDHWYGVSCILGTSDQGLAQYIADEIAGSEHGMHTIYGLTAQEIGQIASQLALMMSAIADGLITTE